jgi:hypothetical protein
VQISWRERTWRTKILRFACSASRSAGFLPLSGPPRKYLLFHFSPSSNRSTADVHNGLPHDLPPEALNLRGKTASATLGRQGTALLHYIALRYTFRTYIN